MGWIFLSEELGANVKAYFLFIAQSNLEGRNIIIDSSPDKCTTLKKEMNYLKESLDVDINCIDVNVIENTNQEGKTPKELESTYLS